MRITRFSSAILAVLLLAVFALPSFAASSGGTFVGRPDNTIRLFDDDVSPCETGKIWEDYYNPDNVKWLKLDGSGATGTDTRFVGQAAGDLVLCGAVTHTRLAGSAGMRHPCLTEVSDLRGHMNTSYYTLDGEQLGRYEIVDGHLGPGIAGDGTSGVIAGTGTYRVAGSDELRQFVLTIQPGTMGCGTSLAYALFEIAFL